MLPKRTLVAGVKIRGYGIPNEYGEFTFIPEETGAHAGRQKIVFQEGGTTVKETKEPLDYTKRTGYQIYKKALDKGVLLRPLGDVIYFNPPLIIEKDDMDFVTDIALECTEEVLQNNYM